MRALPEEGGVTEISLRIAVPSKGRLAEPVARLFAAAGLSYGGEGRQLRHRLDEQGVEFLLARTDDIPTWIDDRAADLGVAGDNQLAESGLDAEVLLRLGFGRCRLVLAAPDGSGIATVGDLTGARIATSYPRTVQRFLDQHAVKATVIALAGSVELAPALGAAEAIVDLVSSGETLRQNGLTGLQVLLESQAVLFARAGAGEQNVRIGETVAALGAVLAARPRRYLMLNVTDDRLDTVLALLPGLDAPTLLPLARADMHAVHAVVEANDLPRLLGPLRDAGATGILVLPIEFLIP